MTPIEVAIQWGRSGMASIVQRMLENVDDTLFDMGESSRSDDDRRSLFDAMRLLRKSSRLVITGFESALLGTAAGPVAVVYDDLQLVEDHAVEEDIMVSRVVARIEDAAKQALWEFAIRLESLPPADSLRDAFDRLRPQGITKAFRDSVAAIPAVDPSTKLILFKLYERQLMSDCSTVYEGLNSRLEAAGISPKKLARRDPGSHLPPGEAERRLQPAFVASWMDAIAPSYQVSANLNSLVSSVFPSSQAGMGIGGSYMSAAPGAGTSHYATPGPALDGSGSLQRLSLVSNLVGELTRGWDGADGQAANQLLVPLIRIALSDPAFFANPQHPARVLLASLGTSRNVADVRAGLDAVAAGLQPPAEVAPLSGAELRQFLLSQRSAGASTSARIEEGRAAAYQQIRSIGSGRDLPVGVAGFLTQVWLPMVSALHLKFGPESEEMRRATQILQRLFGECRWLPEMKDESMIRGIIDELAKGLQEIAVPPPLVTKATTVLEDGLGKEAAAGRLLDLETLTERAPAGAQPEKAESNARPPVGDDAAWRAALPVGSWFRVFDRAGDQTQWLSAGVLYPHLRHLSFNGFDGSVRLTIERVLFLEDLISGKAEAVEPTELQQSSIRLLCLEFAGVA